ncbi:hypothetical protein MJG53_009196 [Ovis ammon polii x Ovis aries]|uniref:Uncharacterized protein n=1 Tax=Ovis ammon polii x Ovis aries TaxID=2918886 RepID=A0ACB9UZM9_9CETA|nr:hypothetical protein MJG53_009196 [Ovis ammon polii x Ovis aries]
MGNARTRCTRNWQKPWCTLHRGLRVPPEMRAKAKVMWKRCGNFRGKIDVQQIAPNTINILRKVTKFLKNTFKKSTPTLVLRDSVRQLSGATRQFTLHHLQLYHQCGVTSSGTSAQGGCVGECFLHPNGWSGTRCRDEDKKCQRACGTEKELAVSALLEQANNDAASQCGVRFGVGPTGAPTDQSDSLRHDVFRQLLLRWFCKDFTSFCRF